MDPIGWLAELLATLEAYNLAIWPMQALGYLLGLVTLFFVIKPSRYSSGIIAVILSFLCLRTGIVRLTAYTDTPVNPASAMFANQGVLFAACAPRRRLSFGFRWNLYSVVGLLFVAYAMIGYFVFAYYAYWLRTPPRFGVDPGPIIMFTFGMLLLTDRAVPKLLLVVPALWTLTLLLLCWLRFSPHTPLIVVGVLGTPLIVHKDVMMLQQQPKE